MRQYFLVAVGILIFFYACKEAPKTIEKKEVVMPTSSATFDGLLEAYYEKTLQLYPLNATSEGDTRYNDRLPNDLTVGFREEEKRFYTTYKIKAEQYGDSLLSTSQKMSREVLLWNCNINLERLTFREDLLPINQMWTKQLYIGQLAGGTSAQPFETVIDYQNWLTRLESYVQWMDTVVVRMKEGIEKEHVLPKSLIKKVVPQLKALTNTDIEKHLFYSPIKNLPEDFAAEDKALLRGAYKTMIQQKIIPAYQRLHDFMNTEYMAAGRASSGKQALSEGVSYYEYSIKLYTTTTMTAEAIHQMGLDEVARISKEMETIKKQVGYEGSLKDFFDHVRNKKELMPFKEPTEVVANFNAVYEKMKPQIEKLFDKKPKTPFEVRRTEAFREASASAEYNPGSIDGTRPGIFYVPIPDVTKYNMYADEDLFLHEAIPGHHYQISLTQENEELPKFRKTLWYSAYGEGWALYSESLGKELGLYQDPYQYFGMLGAEMHRAIRLVVDTGLHAKGWSREKAIQYSLDNEAEPEASIISEIERYMANPGQALSYKIGQLKIRELRAKAEKKLGEKFDIRVFHNQVLETGCVPLALLEQKIDNWIAHLK